MLSQPVPLAGRTGHPSLGMSRVSWDTESAGPLRVDLSTPEQDGRARWHIASDDSGC
jgi:hypothetical protein